MTYLQITHLVSLPEIDTMAADGELLAMATAVVGERVAEEETEMESGEAKGEMRVMAWLEEMGRMERQH